MQKDYELTIVVNGKVLYPYPLRFRFDELIDLTEKIRAILLHEPLATITMELKPCLIT